MTKIKVTHFVNAGHYIKKTKEKIIYTYSQWDSEFHFKKQNIVNLSKLNSERAKLKDAKKFHSM